MALSDVHPAERAPGKFAVYSGDGVYVSSVHVYGAPKRSLEFVYFGCLKTAVSLDRCEAVRACHAARRAGHSAWLVRHPVGVLS